METTTALRAITVSLPELETENFFGDTEEEIIANQPKWLAAMETIAARDGVEFVASKRQLNNLKILDVADFDPYEEELFDTAEYSWWDRASDEAWEIVNGAR